MEANMSNSIESPADRADRSAPWWPALVMHALVLALGLVLLWPPGRWGQHDWDYFAHHYEAMRRTVIEYGQFPWWNPWSSGGIPLATNPQLGVLSINFPLVLVFGTYLGLKLAMIVHLVAAAEGARRLAGEWTRDAVARAIVGFVYVANGSVGLYVAMGHVGIELIAFVPWAIWCAFRMERDAQWGYALGGVLAAAVLTSFQYFVVYLFLWLPGQIVWQFWRSNATRRWRLVRGCVSAAAVFFAAAGLRTVLAAELVTDFPRGSFSQIHQRVTPPVLAAMLIYPGQRPEMHFPHWLGHSGLGWHEFGCYVGVAPLVLFLASLRRGWRWWHTLVLVSFWFAIGNYRWYHASGWLTELPVLSTLRVASRWRVLGVLGIALGCGVALGELRAVASRRVRGLTLVVAAAIALDLLWNALPVYRHIFVMEPKRLERAPDDRDFVQLEHPPYSLPQHTAMLATLGANYGAVYSYEPVIGQDSNPYAGRVWPGHEEYRGEYWSPAGPVRLLRWSPNEIVLDAPPHAEVIINQNPGRYWLVNGRRAFDSLRSVDRHAEFRVTADERSRVVLRVWPSAWRAGVMLTAAGLFGVASSYYMNHKLGRRERQHNEHASPG
jgi:hypothetical protein